MILKIIIIINIICFLVCVGLYVIMIIADNVEEYSIFPCNIFSIFIINLLLLLLLLWL